MCVRARHTVASVAAENAARIDMRCRIPRPTWVHTTVAVAKLEDGEAQAKPMPNALAGVLSHKEEFRLYPRYGGPGSHILPPTLGGVLVPVLPGGGYLAGCWGT